MKKSSNVKPKAWTRFTQTLYRLRPQSNQQNSSQSPRELRAHEHPKEPERNKK